MKVSLLLISFNRPAELLNAIRSADSVGFSEVVVLDNGSDPPLKPIEGTRWIRSDENLGVTGGRNLVVQESLGEVFVLLDDDAVYTGSATASSLAELFQRNDRLGVVAGQICRETGIIMSHEFPFRKLADVGKARECAYFVGALVAIRRSAWDEVGGFDSSMFYAHEETDLAMRLVRNGWSLFYKPDFSVVHLPSNSGRQTPLLVLARRFTNRVIYVRRHLPWLVGVPHLTVWFAHIFLCVRPLQWPSLLKIIVSISRSRVERDPIGVLNALHLHRRGFRIFW